MEMYILKFTGCLFIFWLVYVLFFERQKMHKLKRFYLLGAVLLSLSIPLLTITYYVEPVVNDFASESMTIPFNTLPVEAPLQEDPLLTLERMLWLIYGLGVILFATRFIVNLTKLYRQISTNDKVSARTFVYVLLKEYRIPHSFFNYIFLSKTKFENETIPKEVILHEETHAKQLHSLDILIIELLQIVLWFNPLIYILKHHIKLNHEFLADQAVLNYGVDHKNYQHILLQFSSNTSEYQFSSAINYSSFKKRFTVMKTHTSKTRIWLSTLLLLPIIGILYYSFAERIEVEKDNLNLVESIKNDLIEAEEYKLQYVGQNYVEDYLKKYKKYEALRNSEPHYIKKSNKEQLQMEALFSNLGGMYFRMSKANKAKVERPIAPIHPYVKITFNGKTYYKKKSELSKEERATLPPPPPPATKNTKGGPNSNDQVDSFTAPQKEVTKKEMVAYNAWAKQIHSESKVLSEDATWYPPINEQDLIKYSGIYKRMSAQQKKQAVTYPFPGLDMKDSDQNIFISPTTNQQKATKKQIAAYNTWAKAINEKIDKAKANNDVNEYPIVKVVEVNKYKAIYAIMTEAQKKVAEPWPSFPPPPPPAPPAPERPTVIEIAEYDVWAKKMNMAINKAESGNNKSYYPRIKKEDYDKYYKIYRNLMTEAQRENAEPWPNIPPPPPPPPPPPISILDAVIGYAKKGIPMYFEGEELTSDKAIELAKSNKVKGAEFKTINGKKSVILTKEAKVNSKTKKTTKSKDSNQKAATEVKVNGKSLKEGMVTMTSSEFKKLELTLNSGKVKSFKLKIPGVKTDYIKGNTISKTSIANLSTMKKGGNIAIFDIKDDSGSKIPPVIIEIKD